MVRSIRHCLRCDVRFVAHASQERCATCRVGDDSNNNNVNVKSTVDAKLCALPCAKKNKNRLLGSELSSTSCEAENASTNAACIQRSDEQDGARSTKRCKMSHRSPEPSTLRQEEEQNQEHGLSSSASAPPSLLLAASTPLAIIDLCDEPERTQDDQWDQDVGDVAPNRQQQQQQQQKSEQPRAKAWDEEDDMQSEACSEAGDDFNCTQIELGELEDENDNDHLAESEANQVSPEQQQEFSRNQASPPTELPKGDSDRLAGPHDDRIVDTLSKNIHHTVLQHSGHNDDICLICGISLKNLKHRVEQ
jgi:hypothetical protein